MSKNNALSVFSFRGNSVRTVTENREPMFNLADVCKALDLTSPAKVKERLNQKGVTTIHTPTAGGIQPMTFISEQNLYKVIFQSRKPEAEAFTDWVTGEVLPAIRKTGKYSSMVQPELPVKSQGIPIGSLLRMDYKGIPVIPSVTLMEITGLRNARFHKLAGFDTLKEGIDIFRVKGVKNSLYRKLKKAGYNISGGVISLNLLTESGVRKFALRLKHSAAKHNPFEIADDVPALPPPPAIQVIPVSERKGKKWIIANVGEEMTAEEALSEAEEIASKGRSLYLAKIKARISDTGISNC